MTVNERIKKYIDYKNISQTDLAKSILIHKNQVSNWLASGETVPDKALIKMVRYYPDINARWLITGEGEMLEGQKITPTEDELMEFGGTLLDRLLEEKGKASVFENEIKHLNLEIERLKSEINSRGQQEPRARAG